MNKNDCESMGYYLASSKSLEELEARLFTLDPRIEPIFQDHLELQGQDDATQERYYELMAEELGQNWMLMKKVAGLSKKIWNQAYKEIRA